MLRHLGLIAVCACIVASVGCDGGKVITAPAPPPAATTVTVEFGGRVVNADAGGPVGNVQVSVQGLGFIWTWSGRMGRSEEHGNVRWRWHIYPPTQSPE